jgi:secondary thiamine-phosphate synthase enzyme
MRQQQHEFSIRSNGPGAHDFTREVVAWVRSTGIQEGLLTLFARHTSASLMIQENYDPEVMRDMERFLRRLVPPGDPIFRHDSEGPDDMPAHVRSALTHTTLTIPVSEGEPTLGTWQGIYLYEHRDRPHHRRVVAHLVGE